MSRLPGSAHELGPTVIADACLDKLNTTGASRGTVPLHSAQTTKSITRSYRQAIAGASATFGTSLFGMALRLVVPMIGKRTSSIRATVLTGPRQSADVTDALRGEARSAKKMYAFQCQKRANIKLWSVLSH